MITAFVAYPSPRSPAVTTYRYVLVAHPKPKRPPLYFLIVDSDAFVFYRPYSGEWSWAGQRRYAHRFWDIAEAKAALAIVAVSARRNAKIVRVVAKVPR